MSGDEIWEKFKGGTKRLKHKKTVDATSNSGKIEVSRNPETCHISLPLKASKMEGKDIAPIERRMYDKIKNNELRIEGKLDLHGYTIDEARMMVIQFINSSYILGKRLLCVVTGKGKHSEFQNLTLNQVVPNILKHDVEVNSKIAYMGLALPKDGGGGAYYIYLKRNRGLK